MASNQGYGNVAYTWNSGGSGGNSFLGASPLANIGGVSGSIFSIGSTGLGALFVGDTNGNLAIRGLLYSVGGDGASFNLQGISMNNTATGGAKWDMFVGNAQTYGNSLSWRLNDTTVAMSLDTSGSLTVGNNLYVPATRSIYIGSSQTQIGAGSGAVVTGVTGSLLGVAVPGVAFKLALNTSGDLGLGASLYLSGNTGQKASGTTWSNPSDARIKTVLGPYTTGLSALLNVNPIRYNFNGKGGIAADTIEHVSIIAQEMVNSMPETVSTYKGKLNPTDTEDSDIFAFDASNVTWALVNAVKELSGRLVSVEARLEAAKI
jgi:hypothetical protein